MDKDYFPPKDSKLKWIWNPPDLRHKPWWARMQFFDQYRKMTLQVSRDDCSGKYIGSVQFSDLNGIFHYKMTRKIIDPKEALLATEKIADKMLADQNLPFWAEEALKAGWRPR